MRFEEINRKFTEKVAEYLANGYVFNTASMAGHQGEIAKVDMTGNGYIVRINLEKTHSYEDIDENRTWSYEALILTVGVSYQEDIKPNSNDTWRTLWSNKCHEICREMFYIIGDNWYVGHDEALAAYMKRTARRRARRLAPPKKFSDKAVALAVNYVRRQPRCSRAKADDVRLEKNCDHNEYVVRYKDRFWTLK